MYAQLNEPDRLFPLFSIHFSPTLRRRTSCHERAYALPELRSRTIFLREECRDFVLCRFKKKRQRSAKSHVGECVYVLYLRFAGDCTQNYCEVNYKQTPTVLLYFPSSPVPHSQVSGARESYSWRIREQSGNAMDPEEDPWKIICTERKPIIRWHCQRGESNSIKLHVRGPDRSVYNLRGVYEFSSILCPKFYSSECTKPFWYKIRNPFEMMAGENGNHHLWGPYPSSQRSAESKNRSWKRTCNLL